MGPIRNLNAAAQEGRVLIAELQDGFAAEFEVDWDMVVDQFTKALTGQLQGKGRLPFKVIVDPKVDA